MIPVLPFNRLEVLDAPMPYIIGVFPSPHLNDLDIFQDVVRVYLDDGLLIEPED
jgi:hypothetical protein